MTMNSSAVERRNVNLKNTNNWRPRDERNPGVNVTIKTTVTTNSIDAVRRFARNVLSIFDVWTTIDLSAAFRYTLNFDVRTAPGVFRADKSQLITSRVSAVFAELNFEVWTSMDVSTAIAVVCSIILLFCSAMGCPQTYDGRPSTNCVRRGLLILRVCTAATRHKLDFEVWTTAGGTNYLRSAIFCPDLGCLQTYLGVRSTNNDCCSSIRNISGTNDSQSSCSLHEVSWTSTFGQWLAARGSPVL